MRENKGFTLLELLIVVVIIGVLALIASSVLLNAANKAKDAAVKANVSAAASSMTAALSVDLKTPAEAIEDSLSVLNNPDGIDNNRDEIKSPYDSTLDGFIEGDTGDRGQVALEASTSIAITIRGFGAYGSEQDPVLVKTVQAPEEELSSSGS